MGTMIHSSTYLGPHLLRARKTFLVRALQFIKRRDLNGGVMSTDMRDKSAGSNHILRLDKLFEISWGKDVRGLISDNEGGLLLVSCIVSRFRVLPDVIAKYCLVDIACVVAGAKIPRLCLDIFWDHMDETFDGAKRKAFDP